MRKAIHILILIYANHRGVILGEAISGDRNKFIRLMNKTAKKLHMKGIIFQNTNRLHNEINIKLQEIWKN